VTSSASACVLCGRPPDLQLPFAWRAATEADAELVPSVPGTGALPVPAAWIECPNCQALLEIRTSSEVLETIIPPAVPPAEEAGPGSPLPPEPASPPLSPPVEEAAAEFAPLSAAAPPPADTPPAPAMAVDVHGNPVEGPPPPSAPIESTTEASPGSVGEGQPAAAASTAGEEPAR